MTNEDLLYSTESSTQNSVMTYMGKESKKEGNIHCSAAQLCPTLCDPVNLQHACIFPSFLDSFPI